MKGSTVRVVETASRSGNLHMSPVSAWEIGRSVAAGLLRIAVPPLEYYNAFLKLTGSRISELGPDILVASSFLPGRIHKDPMDRILIETARRHELTLVTRDRAILAYGAEGHLKTLAC